MKINLDEKILDNIKKECYNLSKTCNKGLNLNINVISSDIKNDYTIAITFKLK